MDLNEYLDLMNELYENCFQSIEGLIFMMFYTFFISFIGRRMSMTSLYLISTPWLLILLTIMLPEVILEYFSKILIVYILIVFLISLFIEYLCFKFSFQLYYIIGILFLVVNVINIEVKSISVKIVVNLILLVIIGIILLFYNKFTEIIYTIIFSLYGTFNFYQILLNLEENCLIEFEFFKAKDINLIKNYSISRNLIFSFTYFIFSFIFQSTELKNLRKKKEAFFE